METNPPEIEYTTIHNQESISLQLIPVLSTHAFFETAHQLLSVPGSHCVSYFAYRREHDLKFILCVANDVDKLIYLVSQEQPINSKLASLSAIHFPLHIYEREITENYGIHFEGHPWDKPVRYAFNRADRSKEINNYPFYQIGGNELHQVGVGPIHAGVIEPGHFRFLCNGENVLHLEIQLGWQHRGVEDLFVSKSQLLQRTILSESIAGDTAVGHSLAFVNAIESLGKIQVSERIEIERTISLELERIAMHVGDISNMNIGLAYQLASSVFGTLRTPIINFTQAWCGNRFGKGLNRVGGTHYPLTPDLTAKLENLLSQFEISFNPMADKLFAQPSVLMRMENIGKVSENQMRLIGAVGMTARMANVDRDLRVSHPFSAYKKHSITSDLLDSGDVWARAMLRRKEIKTSIEYIRDLLLVLKSTELPAQPIKESQLRLQPDSLTVSLVEAWRGEISHCAVTDKQGEIVHYKVKDPSLHNWFALALSLRDLEISDFPINNKSYNLSYCGHDL